MASSADKKNIHVILARSIFVCVGLLTAEVKLLI